MSKLSINLRSAAEVESVIDDGLPEGSRPDLVLDDGAGNLMFTIKGLQLYGLACEHYGFPGKLQSLKTTGDLANFVEELQAEAVHRAQLELQALRDTGNVGGRTRALVDSILFGSIDDIVRDADRTATAFEHGDNICVLPQRRTATENRRG